MKARIFQPAKSALQAGRANTKTWRLEFEPAASKKIDRLMGWTGSDRTDEQVRLDFESRDSAVKYAIAKGLEYSVHEPQMRTLKLKSYSNNFANSTREPWTH